MFKGEFILKVVFYSAPGSAFNRGDHLEPFRRFLVQAGYEPAGERTDCGPGQNIGGKMHSRFYPHYSSGGGCGQTENPERDNEIRLGMLSLEHGTGEHRPVESSGSMAGKK